MRRGGFTLPEVLVAIAIAALLLGVISDLFYKGAGLMLSSQAHLEAATGAQLLMERIHHDLRRMEAADPSAMAGGGPPLAFTARTASGDLEEVRYDLVPGPVPGTSVVSRNGVPMRAAVVKQLTIRAETAPAAAGFPIFGYQVLLLATDAGGKKDFPLVGFTALDAPTRRVLDPYWVPNP